MVLLAFYTGTVVLTLCSDYIWWTYYVGRISNEPLCGIGMLFGETYWLTTGTYWITGSILTLCCLSFSSCLAASIYLASLSSRSLAFWAASCSFCAFSSICYLIKAAVSLLSAWAFSSISLTLFSSSATLSFSLFSSASFYFSLSLSNKLLFCLAF